MRLLPILCALITFGSQNLLAQQVDIHNFHTIINIQPDAQMYVGGNYIAHDSADDVKNAEARFRLNGTLEIKGDIVNNSASPVFLDEGTPGDLVFVGDANQRIYINQNPSLYAGRLGKDTTIYLPSIYLSLSSGNLQVEQTIGVDSAINFDTGNLQITNSDSILLLGGGFLSQETEASRLLLGSGQISFTIPTLSVIDVLANNADPENIYGLGWGVTSLVEEPQGGVDIYRFDQFSPPTQVANGSTASRFYRMDYFRPIADTLENIVLHYFDQDLSMFPDPNLLALYVSSNNGNSWIKIDGETYTPGAITNTFTVPQVPIQGNKLDSDTINWFVIAEDNCIGDNLPNSNEAITSDQPIDKTSAIFQINVCEGEDLTFEYLNPVVNYEWWQSTSPLEENAPLTLTNLQQPDEALYELRLRNDRGCEATRELMVNVWGPPPADFSFTAGIICEGEEVSFTNNTPTTEGNITEFTWDFGDGGVGSELSDPIHIYNTSGIFTVTLTVVSEYGCVGVFQDDITIQPVSQAEFAIRESQTGPEINQICSGGSFFFEPEESMIVVGPTGSDVFPFLTWDFGDGTSETIDPTDFFPPIKETFGETSHQYNVSVDATYTVTLTAVASSCTTSVSYPVQVLAEPDPSFHIQVNGSTVTEACVGDQVEFISDASLIDESAFDYLWSFGDGEISTEPRPLKIYTGNSAYQVDLQITRKTTVCSTQSQQIILINNSPEIILGDQITSCGSSTILDAGNPGATFRWSDPISDATLSTDQTYEVSSASDIPFNISLEVTNIPEGCTSFKEIEVTLNTELDLNLGPDQVACEAETIGTDAFVGATYLWSTGENTPFINVETTGEYWLEVTEPAFGCVTRDTIVVQILNPPAINLGLDREICSGQTLTLNAGGFASYLWSNGTTASSLEVATTGTYWVEVTDLAGCSARDSIYISVNDDFIIDPMGEVVSCEPGCADTTNPDFRMENGISSNSACEDLSVQFISVAAEGDPTAYLYQWDFGDGTTSTEAMPFKTYNSSGNYLVELFITSKIDGCTGLSQDNFMIQAAPNIPFGSIVTSCGSSILLDAENLGSSYRWSDPTTDATLSTDQTYEVSSASSNPIFIKLEVTDTDGCTTIQDTEVRLNTDLDIDLGPNRGACTSTVLGTDEFPGADFLWSTGATSSFIEVTTSGSYWVEVTESDLGCTTRDTVDIQILEVPSPELGGDQILCPGETVILDPGVFESYLWSDGSTSRTLTAGTTGLYWVEVANIEGCTTRDEVQVRVRRDPELNLAEEIQRCNEGPVTIDAGIEGTFYQWGSSVGFTSNERVINVQEPGQYWVTVENEVGCIQTDTTVLRETSEQITASFLVPSVVGLGDFVIIVQLTDPIPEISVWSFGDGAFSDEVNPVHQYTAIGDYEIALAVSNGVCSDTLRKNISVVDSRFVVEEERQQLLEILKIETYPNPVFNELKVKIELSKESPVRTRIYNLTGREVYRKDQSMKEEELWIDFSDELSGVYLVSIQVGTENRLLKVIKPE